MKTRPHEIVGSISKDPFAGFVFNDCVWSVLKSKSEAGTMGQREPEDVKTGPEVCAGEWNADLDGMQGSIHDAAARETRTRLHVQVRSANVSGKLRILLDFDLFCGLQVAAKLAFHCDVGRFYVRVHVGARADNELAAGLNLAPEASVDFEVAFELQPSPELDVVTENCIDLLHTLWNGLGPSGSRKMHEEPAGFAVNSSVMEVREQTLAPLWKVKPSRREGFHKTYYTETAEGDQILIDFNHARQMVRIQVTVEAEGGRQYACIIKSGTILQERDITVGRPMDITTRIAPLRHFIASIPDDMLRKTIGGNYGIPITGPMPGMRRARLVRQRRVPRLQRFLRKKRARESQPASLFHRILRRIPAEGFQIACVGGLALAYLHNLMSIAQFACLVGFFGLWSGAYDWLVRAKNPFLPRIVGMLGISGYSIWLETQYKIWGIFL